MRGRRRENPVTVPEMATILGRVFMTVTTTATGSTPATDLGHLLHKHPDRAQTFSTAHGTAHVFYPRADTDRCTAALLLEIDPVALVRRGGGKGGRAKGTGPDATLDRYVNDRPYAASSLFAVALGAVFRTAMRGQCAARPELPTLRLPLWIEVPALTARGGPGLVERLFAPLGWRVTARPVPLDPDFPEWGDSQTVSLTLSGELALGTALRQLYVLLPVLDGAKHYWITEEEVDKLLRAGDGWLEHHPEQELIAARYLARKAALTRSALERLELARLAAADGVAAAELDDAVDEQHDTEERPAPLAELRRAAILATLRESGATRVVDLGCGQGQLLAELLKEPRFTEIVGVDVSVRALRSAARRLRLEQMGERQASRITLRQGALTYTDSRLTGMDAAVLCEVVEHVDPPRLAALEYAVFGAARPGTVVVTTPNAEYNVRWESLPAGTMRHRDHRFEWTRAEFARWAAGVCERHGYRAEFRPVGEEDPDVGPPTQLALFRRLTPADSDAASAAGPHAVRNGTPASRTTTGTSHQETGA